MSAYERYWPVRFLSYDVFIRFLCRGFAGFLTQAGKGLLFVILLQASEIGIGFLKDLVELTTESAGSGIFSVTGFFPVFCKFHNVVFIREFVNFISVAELVGIELVIVEVMILFTSVGSIV